MVANNHSGMELHRPMYTFVPFKGSNPVPCFCIPQHRSLVMAPTDHERPILVEKTRMVLCSEYGITTQPRDQLDQQLQNINNQQIT